MHAPGVQHGAMVASWADPAALGFVLPVLRAQNLLVPHTAQTFHR